MRVLIQKSHHSPSRPDGWSGAPGEAEWVGKLAHEIDLLLAGSPIQASWTDGDLGIVPNDSDGSVLARHPELKLDYDAFVSLHYDADVYGGLGGWFWDRAATSLSALQDDTLGAMFQARYSQLLGVPAWHPERRNPNTRDYYAFRLTSTKTPGVIVEHGVGWGADKSWLNLNLVTIARVWADTLYRFGGIPLPAPNTFWTAHNDADPVSWRDLRDAARRIGAGNLPK